MKMGVSLLLTVCALSLSSLAISESAGGEQVDMLLMQEAVSEADLQGQRGEGLEALTLNQVELEGNHSGNSVGPNSVTGRNFIGNTAFNGASGMFDVFQNSGNNVLYQKATIVNINITD